jgi:hypothetical protein
MPRLPELADRLAALGFERPGREWVLPGFEVAFEAPGEELEPGDEAESVELASGRRVLVLSIEDLLLWRFRGGDRDWSRVRGVGVGRDRQEDRAGELQLTYERTRPQLRGLACPTRA